MRSALHAAGLRYRVDSPVRVEGSRSVRPDVVFPKQRLAVFIDGCFWHGCPMHGTAPTTNADYWGPKIAENRERDRRHTAALEEGGWRVVRVWEHDNPQEVAQRVAALVRQSL